MNFIAGILIVLLLLDCLLLVLLVLVQLPKKDAGAGIAFGGGAADALFGAGSGNTLTKITKWAAGIFFALALILGFVEQGANRSNSSSFQKALEQSQSQMPVAVPPSTPLSTAPSTPAATNGSAAMPSPSVPAGGAPATTPTN